MLRLLAAHALLLVVQTLTLLISGNETRIKTADNSLDVGVSTAGIEEADKLPSLKTKAQTL